MRIPPLAPGRRPLPSLAVLFLVLGAVPPAAARADAAAPPDRSLSPYFLVEGGDPGVDRLPLEKTSAAVKIAGSIADVTVRQTYKNAGQRPINARYVFPASTRAAVHGMKMTVGQRVVVARIRERQQARREFEEAKAAGKTASLLEQERPNVFTMSVAQVMPGDVVEVELGYTEFLVPEEGVYEFVYPTVVGPRYPGSATEPAPATDRWLESPYLHQAAPPTYAFDLRATVSTGVPLRDLTSPSHRIVADWRGPSTADVRLDGEAAGGNRDFVLRYRLAGEDVQAGLLLHRGPDENFFVLRLEPPRRVRPEQVPPREYIFVVDVSGSMAGFPLEVSKALMADLLAHLRPTDRFNLVFFAGASWRMAPQSLPATPENRARALAEVDRQHGGGGTELLAALRMAMETPRPEGASRSVVVVTDGFISAEREAFDHVRDHLGDANVFAMGIGTSVNRHLIEGLARAGLGEPFVVTQRAEAADSARRFRAYVESPVLTRVRVDFGDFDAYDVEPAAIPDVLAERPVVVFGKWRGPPRGTLTLTGLSGQGAYARKLDVAAAGAQLENPALRPLWARQRIARLVDFGAASGDGRERVVELGLRYNLLTPFTSFVAVHEVVRNPGGAAADVAQPLPLPQGVEDTAVGGGMQVGAEPGLRWLLLPAAALAALALLRRRPAPPRGALP